MGIAIHSQNQSIAVVPRSFGYIGTQVVKGENAYKRAGTLIIKVNSALSQQAEQLIIAGTATGTAAVDLIVTSALFTGGSVTIQVPVANLDTATVIALDCRVFLQANAQVAKHFTVGGATVNVELVAKVITAADPTFQIFFEGTTVGLADLTSANSTLSVDIAHTPKIEGLDPYTNEVYPILEGVEMTAVGTQILKVHPDLVAAANSIAADVIPRWFRFTMTTLSSDSVDFQVTLNSND